MYIGYNTVGVCCCAATRTRPPGKLVQLSVQTYQTFRYHLSVRAPAAAQVRLRCMWLLCIDTWK